MGRLDYIIFLTPIKNYSLIFMLQSFPILIELADRLIDRSTMFLEDCLIVRQVR
jgi:hypothetical protein